MHGEGERGERIYVAVTCTRTQMLSRGFQIPYLLRNSGSVTMLRNYESGIQKYKTGIVHISLRAVSIEEGEEEMCTGRGRERRRYM